jgi:hypothetical protein
VRSKKPLEWNNPSFARNLERRHNTLRSHAKAEHIELRYIQHLGLVIVLVVTD